MTDELSPRARDIVDAAREAEGPTEADRRRVRAAVFAAIGAGATTAGSAAAQAATEAAMSGSASGAAATVGATVPASVKILAVAAAAAAIGVGGYTLTRSHDDAPKPERPTPSPVVSPVDRTDEPAPDPVDPTAEPTEDTPVVQPEPEPEMEFEPDHIKARRQPSSIEAERTLLIEARSLRRGGNAHKALSILDDYTRTFSGGALLEERSALRVLVLCDLGNTDKATRAAQRFVKKWPSSVQGKRVRGSCVGSEL